MPTRRTVRDPITVLIVVPTLDVGAADAGAVGLVRILSHAGHRVIVVSRRRPAGRRRHRRPAPNSSPLDIGSNNPVAILRNAVALSRLAREQQVRRHPRASAAPRPGAPFSPRG